MSLSEVLRGAPIGNIVSRERLGEALADDPIQEVADYCAGGSEVSSGVDIAKEAANSIGGKDVIDPPIRELISSQKSARAARFDIA